MTDPASKGPFGRTLVYLALALFIASVVLIAASALTSGSTPKVGFDMTVEVAEQEVTAFGIAHLADGRIDFSGTRLTLAGRIEGDQVKIEGTIALPNQPALHAFRASGRIVGDRLNLPVNGTDGRRIGTLRLELPSD
jgi:hypothetical protein